MQLWSARSSRTVRKWWLSFLQHWKLAKRTLLDAGFTWGGRSAAKAAAPARQGDRDAEDRELKDARSWDALLSYCHEMSILDGCPVMQTRYVQCSVIQPRVLSITVRLYDFSDPKMGLTAQCAQDREATPN